MHGTSFGFRLGALAVILACIAVRVCVSFEPIPYWDGDPTVLGAVTSSLGPTASVAIDLVTLLAAVAGFVSSPRAARPGLFEAGLVFLPLIVLWKHFGTSVEDLRVGGAWLSAGVGALGLKTLCADPGLRRMAMATIASVPLMLAAKGASQVTVEHPQTVRAFEENREQFLAAQGWTADSAQARAFERRLRQPEATAWFGLSNVYATFAAFGLIAFLGWAFVIGGDRPGWRFTWAACGAMCAGSLFLSQSKGGVGAAAVGIVMLAIGFVVRRREGATRVVTRLGWAIGLGVVVAVLAAVVARGLVGEKVGELSILFRWFYMQGAARIFVENALLGVGPAGFKDAYMIAKPVLSPEEVTSPHSVMLDFAATLGICGLAWCCWWLWMAAKNGVALTTKAAVEIEGEQPARTGIERRVVFLICALTTVAGALVERETATPEAAMFRMAGLMLGTLGAFAALEALRSTANASWVFAAAALGVIAHAQIEVTPVWPNACGWVAAVLACGASIRTAGDGATVAGARPWAAVGGVVAIVMIGVRVPAMARWELALRDAAAIVRGPAEFRARLENLANGRARGDTPHELAEELSRAQGRRIGDTFAAMQRGVEDLQVEAADRAIALLAEGAQWQPDAGQTWRAAARLSMQLSNLRSGRVGKEAAMEDALRAEGFARRACDLARSRAASYSWLGTLLAARAGLFGDDQALFKAAEAWETAAAIDPYGMNSPVKLAETYVRLGNRAKASEWAKRALNRDSELRLDPLVGLSPAQRAELMKVAGGT